MQSSLGKEDASGLARFFKYQTRRADLVTIREGFSAASRLRQLALLGSSLDIRSRVLLYKSATKILESLDHEENKTILSSTDALFKLQIFTRKPVVYSAESLAKPINLIASVPKNPRIHYESLMMSPLVSYQQDRRRDREINLTTRHFTTLTLFWLYVITWTIFSSLLVHYRERKEPRIVVLPDLVQLYRLFRFALARFSRLVLRARHYGRRVPVSGGQSCGSGGGGWKSGSYNDASFQGGQQSGGFSSGGLGGGGSSGGGGGREGGDGGRDRKKGDIKLDLNDEEEEKPKVFDFPLMLSLVYLHFAGNAGPPPPNEVENLQPMPAAEVPEPIQEVAQNAEAAHVDEEQRDEAELVPIQAENEAAPHNVVVPEGDPLMMLKPETSHRPPPELPSSAKNEPVEHFHGNMAVENPSTTELQEPIQLPMLPMPQHDNGAANVGPNVAEGPLQLLEAQPEADSTESLAGAQAHPQNTVKKAPRRDLPRPEPPSPMQTEQFFGANISESMEKHSLHSTSHAEPLSSEPRHSNSDNNDDDSGNEHVDIHDDELVTGQRRTQRDSASNGGPQPAQEEGHVPSGPCGEHAPSTLYDFNPQVSQNNDIVEPIVNGQPVSEEEGGSSEDDNENASGNG